MLASGQLSKREHIIEYITDLKGVKAQQSNFLKSSKQILDLLTKVYISASQIICQVIVILVN